MRVVVTAQGPQLNSPTDPRFGRARYLVVVDTESGEHSAADNDVNLNAVQGAGIQTGRKVVELQAEAVITGTIMMIGVTCLVGSIVTDRAGRATAVHEDQAAFDASSAPHRIMIPLQEREGARELLDVALLLREKRTHEPVYPIRVVQEGSDSEQQVAAAEKILAHTVVRAMASGVPVTPLTSVDVSVTSGILRAVRDHRISMVLLQWDGRVGSKTQTFGRIIDTIVEQSVQLVMVSRFCEPVSTHRPGCGSSSIRL